MEREAVQGEEAWRVCLMSKRGDPQFSLLFPMAFPKIPYLEDESHDNNHGDRFRSLGRLGLGIIGLNGL